MSRMTACWECGEMRWAGYGPCSKCGSLSPEYLAEIVRINEAREAIGLAPLPETPAITTNQESRHG
jgi:hypothetical protein